MTKCHNVLYKACQLHGGWVSFQKSTTCCCSSISITGHLTSLQNILPEIRKSPAIITFIHQEVERENGMVLGWGICWTSDLCQPKFLHLVCLHFSGIFYCLHKQASRMEIVIRKRFRTLLLVSLLNTQCFGDFTPHQLSLSRLRKIVPERHHLYTALQAKPSPGIQIYRDVLFPAGQTRAP